MCLALNTRKQMLSLFIEIIYGETKKQVSNYKYLVTWIASSDK